MINRLAKKLQNYMVVEANRMYGDSQGWDKPWRLKLLKALILWFGFIFVVMIYSMIFSKYGN